MGCTSSRSVGGGPFAFKSGLPDCCSSNPENYKVVAEIAGVARLVEMCMKPGAEDKPHDHPSHSMYFATPAKLQIQAWNDGKLSEPEIKEIPAGFAPIFPPGAHVVKNVGDAEARVLFVEEYPNAPAAGAAAAGFVSPFDCSGDCYTKLAEDDKWVTGILDMKSGDEDKPHNHKDHLIYVLEGTEVTIYPDCDKAQGKAIPIEKYHGIPAPVAAGPIFSNHCLKNTGGPLKLLFFERK